MKKTILLSLLICTICIDSYSQITGTIKGKITDESSGEPIPFATVQILDHEPTIGAVADFDGEFIIENIPVGRYSLKISFVGYDPVIIHEQLVTSGKDLIINRSMRESYVALEEVVVRAEVNKDAPVNPLSGISARMLSVEEAKRYAGGFDDPARLASSFAGVNSGLQNNGIVVRGNNPKSLSWRMEGVEIGNPNHFADMAAFGGGGLTALSSQMLDNSDFITGAFPAFYNNALSGVFDLKMRNGNSDKHEHAFQVGILGIDASSEGPIGGGKSTYLFNYRYSALGLLEPILPEDAAGTKYQDLAFKFKLPTENAGLFSLWGIGLVDRSGTVAVDNIDELEYLSDLEEQDAKQHMGAFGLKHIIYTGKQSFLESDIALISSGLDYTSDLHQGVQPVQIEKIKNTNLDLVLQTAFNTEVTKNHTLQTGIRAKVLNYKLLLQNMPQDDLVTVTDDNGSNMLLSAFSQSKIQFNRHLSMLGGVNFQYFELNEQAMLEPRLSFEWQTEKRMSFGLAYGLHSRLEKLHYYLTTDATGNSLNKNLKLSKAHHVVGTFNLSVNDYLRLKVEPYYQHLFDIPMIPGTTFSFINLADNWFINEKLSNEGIGRNYGLDVTLERFLNKGYYYLLTTSVFKSQYQTDDQVWRSTAFDRSFAVNALVGKEWFMGSKDSNILGLNIRLTYQGGQRYTPIDIPNSKSQQEVIEFNDLAYTGQFDPFLLMHLSATYRINKPNKSSIWTLSILNANLANEFEGFDYNLQTGNIDKIGDALIIPSLSYKIEF